MKNRTQKERKPVAWEGTNVGGLLRHVKSGTYYSRISVRGKLRWESLRTKDRKTERGKNLLLTSTPSQPTR